MKIAMLGAGGVGSVIGAHLVRAGEEVTFIARGQRAVFVQHQGITLTGRAHFTVPVTVTTHPHEVQEADVLMVTVKVYDMEAALTSISHLQAQSVPSFQKGILQNEQLARTFGGEKVLGATGIIGGEVLPDGTVRHTQNPHLFLGELPSGTSKRVHTLVAPLTRAGSQATASPQIQTAEWSKYALFVGTIVPAVLTRLEVYKSLTDPDRAWIMAQLMRESGVIATRMGIPLDDEGLMPLKTLGQVPL